MAHKSEAAGSDMARLAGLPAFQLGAQQSEAILNLQKEMLAVCQEASHSWVNRVKSEVELWSDLASKLSASKSVPDSVDAYRDTVAQRMKLAAEDGQRLFEEGQKIIGVMARSFPAGVTGST